jgi:hypothetical protein
VDAGRLAVAGVVMPHVGAAGGGRALAAHDEALGRHRRRGLLRLALVQNLLDGGGRLVVIQRGRVALDVVTERSELVYDLLIVELNAVALELLGDFMNALLRHIALDGLLLRRRVRGAAP